MALLLASAAAFATLAPLEALIGVAFAALALWLAKSDLDSYELPDLANLAVAVLGSAWIVTLPDASLGLLHAAFRAAAAAACFAAIKWSYARLRGLEGLGWGDVKLAGAGAIWLDWSQLPIALLIAAVAGILAVAGQARVAQGSIGKFVPIPFGAFLAPSIWLVWLAGRSSLF